MTILLFICALPNCANSQQWEAITLEEFSNTILSLEAKIEEGISYSFDADYAFFEQLTSQDTTLKVSNSVVFQSSKNLLNFEQFDKMVIQTNKIQITCDTAYKQIIINYPNETFVKRKVFADFEGLINSQCTVFKKSMGGKNGYSITFGDESKYKGAEIWVDKNGLTTKYILYAGKTVLDDSKETEQLIQPRMEVAFKNYVFGSKVDAQKILTVSSFFLNEESLEPVEQYKEFEIIDLRN